MTPADAAEAVRTQAVTGGRFALLLHVASAVATSSVAAIARKLDAHTRCALTDLGLSPTHTFFVALVAGGRIMEDVARDFLSASELDALLRANVLALHPDGTYTAHARATSPASCRKPSAQRRGCDGA